MKRKEFDMVIATLNISADWISEKLRDQNLGLVDRADAAEDLWALEESIEILESHRELGIIE